MTDQHDHNHNFFLAFAKESYKKRNYAKTLQGYTLDDDLSNTDNVVYFNNENVIQAIRGSDFGQIKDIITDVGIFLGIEKTSAEFRSSVRIFNKILKKYKNHKKILVGHSKGGRLSITLLNHYPNKIDAVFGFNVGTSIKHLRDALKDQLICNMIKSSQRCNVKAKIHISRVKFDPLSFLSRYEGNNDTRVVQETQTGLNPHTLSNFTYQGGSLYDISMRDLKKMIKDMKLPMKKYHKLRKNDLINEINKHVDISVS